MIPPTTFPPYYKIYGPDASPPDRILLLLLPPGPFREGVPTPLSRTIMSWIFYMSKGLTRDPGRPPFFLTDPRVRRRDWLSGRNTPMLPARPPFRMKPPPPHVVLCRPAPSPKITSPFQTKAVRSFFLPRKRLCAVEQFGLDSDLSHRCPPLRNLSRAKTHTVSLLELHLLADFK